jgi:hypothetical protein
MKKELKISISKEMVSAMSGLELVTYCYCNAIISSQLCFSGVSAPITEESLGYFIYQKPASKYQIGEIRKSLYKIAESNEINFKKIKSLYIIDEKSFQKKRTSLFTTVSFSEVKKIIDNTKNPTLLKYFILLMLTRRYDKKYSKRIVSTLTNPYFAKMCNVSNQTISNYNKTLENLGLIYIHRIQVNGVKIKNYYGRKCDEKFIRCYTSLQDPLDMI